MMQNAKAAENSEQIFRFLQQYTALKFKPQRNNDKDTLIWFSDLPEAQEIRHALQHPLPKSDELPDTWLTVKKPKPNPAPNLPEELEGFVKGALDNYQIEPVFEAPIFEEHEIETAENDLAISLENLYRYWNSYLVKWIVWSKEEQEIQEIQKIYLGLLKIHQSLTAEAEKFEFCVGLGFLTWKSPSGVEIRRHLLAARASLEFDVQKGIISIKASGDGANTALELDMLDPSDRPDQNVVREIEQELSERGEDLWSNESLPPLLQTWVNAMDGRAANSSSLYKNDIKAQTGASEQIVVHFAPALILRKRSERGLNQAYSAILQEINGIPQTLKPFLGITEPNNNYAEDNDQFHKEIYFPLPANDQQIEIIRRLKNQQGVLVQGPPGTGKSHTIVNLVSHLLATDQRVLVTSHTPRALKVLRDKFPDNLAALCVTHLRGEEGAGAILERSVREILERSHSRNKDREEQILHHLAAELEKSRQQEWDLLDTLRNIREGETHQLQLGHYSGTAQQIARVLKKEEDQFSWISELLHGENPSPEAPITSEQALQLLTYLRFLKEDEQTQQELEQLELQWPAPDELVNPQSFAEICRLAQESEKNLQALQTALQHPHFTTLKDMSAERRQQVADNIERVATLLTDIEQHPSKWLHKASEAVLRGEKSLWDEVKERTSQLLPKLKERADWLDQIKISGTDNIDSQILKADAVAVQQHLSEGGKWSNFMGLGRPAAVKDRLYLQQVRVNGQVADTPEVLDKLIKYLRTKEEWERLESVWKNVQVETSGSATVKARFWSEQQNLLTDLDELEKKISAVKKILQQNQLPQPKWWDKNDLQSYLDANQAVNAMAEVARRHLEIKQLEDKLTNWSLDNNPHPITARLLEAMSERDSAKYAAAYDELPQLAEQLQTITLIKTWEKKMLNAALSWLIELRRTAEQEHWQDKLANIEEAWKWWYAEQKLAEQVNPDVEAEYRTKLNEVRTEIRETLGKLAAAKAWNNTLDRLTPREMQGLEGWRQAMKRLGKGTGKNAGRYRRAARESLEQARSALPAWIMPLYLVAETFEMKADIFDVIIVDEASQAGPEALFLSFLAKKVVIVGDDKQIEPDSVGISAEAVDGLVSSHLANLPLNARIALSDRKASFFSFGAFSYSPAISLREHFRCMPEIIKFSSDLSYADQPLIALRQFGSDRLPPLRVKHIKDGYREGKINRPEAQAIVEQIRECLALPSYANKTFGVISLMGDDQAEEIGKLLRAEISEAEWESRRIVCGNSYSFQGDERDVIFLSMVDSASDSRLSLRSRDNDTFQPRYNVAASRARDQLWLFHSVDLNNLKSEDLRASLIRHMHDPEMGALQPFEEERDLQIRQEARQPSRGQRKPPEPFDSWFEVDVYLELVDRGYQVIPQFQLAGYYIDMVVVGIKGRLAIECDGDHWHGPEQYSKDMHRQQILERAGMQFWRVRGSTFARDPELALEDLWQTLDSRGVHPQGDPRNNHNPPIETTVVIPESNQEPAPDHTMAPSPSVLTEQNDNMSTYMAADTFQPQLTTPAMPSAVPEAFEAVAPIAPVTPMARDAEAQPQVTANSDTTIKISKYNYWEKYALPDPRQDDVTQAVMTGLMAILEAEGPMLCRFLYKRYAESVGLRYSKVLQSSLNSAMALALRKALVDAENEWGKSGQIALILRKKGAEKILLREIGPRDFMEIPPSELAALMQLGIEQQPSLRSNQEELFRYCINTHGAQRLTTKRRELLEIAHQLLNLTP